MIIIEGITARVIITTGGSHGRRITSLRLLLGVLLFVMITANRLFRAQVEWTNPANTE